MEKFKINSVRAELSAWLHPIENHLVIHVQDECSMTVDRGNGDEEEYEYGDASIMMDKKRVIKLRDALNDFLDKVSE